jgi:hypothetical protein
MLMPALIRFRRSIALVLTLALVPLARTGAQSADDILPTDGTEALIKESKEGPSRNVSKLFKGEMSFDPKEQKHRDALDFEARWITYRLTWPEYQEGKDPNKSLDRIFTYYEGGLAQLAKNKDYGKAIAPVFCKAIVKHALEVIDNTRKPIAQINAARILARLVDVQADNRVAADDLLARLAPPETGKPPVMSDLADALVQALNHKNDAVKYYAARGLGDLFRVLQLSKGKDKLDPKIEEKIAAALGELILRRIDFVKNTPEDEIEGYRVLRRQAVRALAQVRKPKLSDTTKPALVLLKVVAADGLLPPPRADERVEAAIGLGLMRPDEGKQYQPDYAVYHIALSLAEIARLVEIKAEKERPWKVLAARLSDALTEMKTQAKNDYVAKIVEKTIKDVLTSLETGASRPVKYSAFADAILKMPPPSQSLFKDDDKSKVTPPPEPKEK